MSLLINRLQRKLLSESSCGMYNEKALGIWQSFKVALFLVLHKVKSPWTLVCLNNIPKIDVMFEYTSMHDITRLIGFFYSYFRSHSFLLAHSCKHITRSISNTIQIANLLLVVEAVLVFDWLENQILSLAVVILFFFFAFLCGSNSSWEYAKIHI